MWSLKRFTVDESEVHRLNAYGILAPTSEWALDIEGLTLKDHRALLEHIKFIAVHAIDNDFKDSTHVA